VFVHPEEYIRFYPFVNPTRSSGNVTLTIQAWDGSSMNATCSVLDNNSKSQETFTGRLYLLYVLALPVSENNETFVYELVYLNRAPFVFNHNYNISTNEDTVSEK